MIRAKRKQVTGDSNTIELIPHKKLEGDLPAVLIEGHVHWLNLSTSVMEVRPLDSLWETSSENWKIDCTPGQYRMQKGTEFLVDIRSKTWDMVSGLLRPFDMPQNLLVSVSPIDSSQPISSLQLSVVLLRYGLSFYVDEDGDLQSYNIRGMVYDEDQSVGTLFGLVNQLVLRPKIRDVHAVELIPRCVLIPEGEISFKLDGHHVRVEINTHLPPLRRVTYQTYRVDTDMGCLTGNVSLANMLYRAYLHALTSGCSPDPLTGRSGTEEALSLLWSASCWSITRFSSREAVLLSLIASICPERRSRYMTWLDLPSIAQYHELYVVANGIKNHCERMLSFHESQPSDLFKSFPSRDMHLLERSALRAAYLFPPRFSGQPSGKILDVRYSARDLVKDSSGEQRAYTAATLVHHWTASATTTDILSMMVSWKGSVSGTTTLSLRYDRSWLAPNLPLIWLKAYELLRGDNKGKRFQLLFSLPAMAYASSELTKLVPVFVAFGSDPRFQLEGPPRYKSYRLSEGYHPSQDQLRNCVSYCAHSFERSPENAEPAGTDESPRDLQRRRLKMYNDRRDLDTNATVPQLLNAWPCETPPRCPLNPDLYNVSDFTSKVQKHFSSCYHNLKLKEHLTRVQVILNDVNSQASPIPTLRYSFQPSQSIPSRTSWLLTVDQLFVRSALSLPAPDRLPSYIADNANTSLSGSTPLHQLIATAEAKAVNTFQRRYVSALRTSAECFGSEASLVAHQATKLPTAETLVAHYTCCRTRYIEGLDYVKQHLGPKSQNEQALEQSGQWPRITAHTLFWSLASNSPVILSDHWKECLIQLTLIALELQRARRLLRRLCDNLREELRAELQNEGCDGWNAETHPDWLLIQVCCLV